MIKEKTKKILDKFPDFRKNVKKIPLYQFIKDNIFCLEQKKEKRIEKNKGLEGMIDYCKKWYKSSTGLDLNLENPKTLTDKQQWLKFYDNSDLKVLCSDKYQVRNYVTSKIGSEYLVPLISIGDKDRFYNANDIDFDKLPNQFVLSCNHGSSMTIVVEDKSKLTKQKIYHIKRQLNRWLKIDVAYVNAFDFVYKGIIPCIIITEYLSNGNSDLKDYKVMCFNGNPKYMWIDSGRFGEHKRTVYDMEFKKVPFTYNNYPEEENEKPTNFDEMIELSKILCKEFVFVRVDFYSVSGKTYFGEITFNSGAGRDLLYPSEYNEIVGQMLELK